jgi:integrase
MFDGDGKMVKSTSRAKEADAILVAEALLAPEHTPVGNIPPARMAELALLKERSVDAAKLLRAEKRVPWFHEATLKFQSSRASRGCSDRYLETLSFHFKKFERFVGSKPLTEISVDEVNNFLQTCVSPKTRKTVRGSLVTLGEYCRRQGWLAYDVPTVFERSDCPIVKRKEHGIYTPEEMTKILHTAEEHDPSLIPWLVLGAFCGMRAAERDRITWDSINFETRSILLSTDVTKTAKRRLVNMSDNTVAWLTAYRDQPLNFVEAKVTDVQIWYIRLRKILLLAGVPRVKNGLRASAASYHLMLHEHAGKTSLQMGHSISELETTYFQPTLQSAAKSWFDILPSKKPKQEKGDPENAQ